MAPKSTAAVLAKFRERQREAGKVLEEGARAREEKLKAKAQGAKPAARKPPAKPRAKPTASGASDGTAASGPANWKEGLAAPRKAALPLGLRHKQVLDFLQACAGEGRSAAEVLAATGRDLTAEPDLARALADNPKVAFADADEGGVGGGGGGGGDAEPRWAYVPDASGVCDRETLLAYVRRRGRPVAVSEVADAYRSVLKDVEALKREGALLGLYSSDPDLLCDVLYPIDPGLSGLALDADVAALWHSTEVPEDDEELAAELGKAGLAPTARKAPRKRAAEKRKKARKAARLRAVTNVHLMHLLEGSAPVQID